MQDLTTLKVVAYGKPVKDGSKLKGAMIAGTVNRFPGGDVAREYCVPLVRLEDVRALLSPPAVVESAAPEGGEGAGARVGFTPEGLETIAVPGFGVAVRAADHNRIVAQLRPAPRARPELPEGCPETVRVYRAPGHLVSFHADLGSCDTGGCTPVEIHPVGTRALLAAMKGEKP